MTDVTDQIEVLSLEQTTRAMAEVIETAGEAGISHENLEAAIDALEEWVIKAAMWRLWEDGRIRLGWNTDDQDLTLRVVEASPA